MKTLNTSLLAITLTLVAGGVQAFTAVDREDGFLGLVTGKELTRLGITLIVTPDGAITGRAFGRDVTGRWDWSDDGFFCREMRFGQRPIPRNCQQVLVNGATLRFIADRGTGDTADLRLK